MKDLNITAIFKYIKKSSFILKYSFVLLGYNYLMKVKIQFFTIDYGT